MLKLSEYTVKRKSNDVWEIWHGDIFVATVDRKTAMAFILGKIDPAQLAAADGAAGRETVMVA